MSQTVAEIKKIRTRKTPNCINPYTATLKGFGEYGWGKTSAEAREKLISLLSKRDDVQIAA